MYCGSSDVYSYPDDESVLDPQLAQHLAFFGLDFSSLRKVNYLSWNDTFHTHNQTILIICLENKLLSCYSNRHGIRAYLQLIKFKYHLTLNILKWSTFLYSDWNDNCWKRTWSKYEFWLESNPRKWTRSRSNFWTWIYRIGQYWKQVELVPTIFCLL